MGQVAKERAMVAETDKGIYQAQIMVVATKKIVATCEHAHRNRYDRFGSVVRFGLPAAAHCARQMLREWRNAAKMSRVDA